MSFSFIHVADIHLGRLFPDSRQTNAILENTTHRIFENLINFAIEQDVDFILIAGDTFDSTSQDLYSKLILKKGLDKLENSNIKVFLIAGNHDPLYSYNPNTFNYNQNSLIKIIGLNTKNKAKIEIRNKSNNPCAILRAMSFEKAEFYDNPTNYFDAPTLEEKKLFNIGLLHCEIGSKSNSPYAPCNISDLKSLNYDYWALGHIHVPLQIEENIIYAGTIQGRNSKEIGIHGFRLIKVEDGKIKENNLIPFDTVRYETMEIDITNIEDKNFISTYIANELFSKIDLKNSVELTIIELSLIGITTHYNFIEKELNDIITRIEINSQGKILISSIKNRTYAKINYEDLKTDTGIVGEITNIAENQQLIEKLYSQVNSQLENVIRNCFFSEEELNEIKEETLSKVKEKALSIAQTLYNNERIDYDK